MVFYFSIASCEKMPDTTILPTDKGKKVWIINEGNFQFGNASIDIYLPDSQSIFKNVFKTANDRNLGDVAQSAVLRDKKLFMVINNSAKISVINAEDYKELYSISIPQSTPRYLHFVSDTKAFVSDVFANKIWIINPQNGSLIESIPTEGWTEHFAAYNNAIFVAQRGRMNDNYVANILVIDANTNKVTDTIALPAEPNSMTQIDNTIFVLCDAQNTESAKLISIDASSKTIIQTLTFSNNVQPIALRSDANNNELFWLANGVFKMNVHSNVLPSSPFISGDNRNLYAIEINPHNQEIYVADAVDYVQSSSVFRYKSNGDLIQTFKAGIITNSFIFE